MRILASLTAIISLAATSALAGPVTLKVHPEDIDGRVTLGDVFDGAGAAADVQIAQRAGPSVVLDAGQLQSQARQAGLEWANESGLRRVVVRRAFAPTEAELATGTAPAAAPRLAPARADRSERVIARNDMVRVAFESDGVRLTVTGRATRHAAVGEPVPVLNVQSGRTIDAVATGPGTAIAGPAARAFRNSPSQFAARQDH